MTCMLQTLSEITFAALLGEYLLKVKPICTTTNSPDNNPSGYTECIVYQRKNPRTRPWKRPLDGTNGSKPGRLAY
jgi:hypothetical protein